MRRPLHGPPCLLARANNLSRNAFCGISATLAEKSPGELPIVFLQLYSSRNPWLCLVETAICGSVTPMTAIERTAYPRFKQILSAKDLAEIYTPTPAERL